MTERFISNEERDSTIPADVVAAIDRARSVQGLEAMYRVDAVMLSAARALQQKYGAAVKHSYAWHKLAGSSVEHKDEVIEPDLVREIDAAVAAFVHDILMPLLDELER